MATKISRILIPQNLQFLAARGVKIQTPSKEVKHFPVVVLGGGSGGCSMASRLCRLIGQGKVAIVEPSKVRIQSYHIILYEK